MEEGIKHWYVALHGPDRPLSLKWETEGDLWIDHLMRKQSCSVTSGVFSDALPVSHVVCTPHAGRLESRLLLVPAEAGLVVLVEGDGAVSDDQVTPWLTAVELATEQVDQAHVELEWSAILGGQDGDRGVLQGLTSPADVGPLHLRPGDKPFVQSSYGYPPRMAASSAGPSYPMIVEGKRRAPDWQRARAAASRDLRRLSALVSVAWDSCWWLRDGPRQQAPGMAEIPPSTWDLGNGRSVQATGAPKIPMEVPAWLNSAWRALDQDSELVSALDAHYEGLLLHQGHPSYSLVAFVASIETIGARYVELVQCPECGSRTGAGKRFRKALRFVLPRKQADRLGRTYTPRSETAHAGILHGAEEAFGSTPFLGLLSRDAALDFQRGTLRELRAASRSLLEKALKGELPTP